MVDTRESVSVNEPGSLSIPHSLLEWLSQCLESRVAMSSLSASSDRGDSTSTMGLLLCCIIRDDEMLCHAIPCHGFGESLLRTGERGVLLSCCMDAGTTVDLDG